jgi:hypothetical protein
MKRTQGVDVSWGRQMYDYLQDYGDIIDMHGQIGTLRFGIPGTTGELVHNSFRLALQSHERFFTDQYNLEGEDYTQVVNDIINECSQLHSYINYYLCWGRKSLFDMEYDSALPSTGNSSNISLLKRKQSLQNAAGGYYKSYPSLINPLVSFPPLKNSDPGTKEPSFQMFPSDPTLDALEDTSDIDHFIEGFED